MHVVQTSYGPIAVDYDLVNDEFVWRRADSFGKTYRVSTVPIKLRPIASFVDVAGQIAYEGEK